MFSRVVYHLFMPPCGCVFTSRVVYHLFMSPCGCVFTSRVVYHLFMPPCGCVFTSRVVYHLYATMWLYLHESSSLSSVYATMWLCLHESSSLSSVYSHHVVVSSQVVQPVGDLFMPPCGRFFISRVVYHLFIANMWSCVHKSSSLSPVCSQHVVVS